MEYKRYPFSEVKIMNIRKAVLDDSKGIAKVHVDSWRSTYRNIIPDAFFGEAII